jgi:CBS domain-containing protein
MKSFDVDHCRPFRPISRRRALRSSEIGWLDPDDEVTSELSTLGALASPPVAVEPITPLAQVRKLLGDHRVPAVVVVDDQHALCGILTRTDVLCALDDARAVTAADAMSGFVFALPAESAIERAAALMASESVGQVVVTAGGDVVGVVSAVDVARHFAIRSGYLVER